VPTSTSAAWIAGINARSQQVCWFPASANQWQRRRGRVQRNFPVDAHVRPNFCQAPHSKRPPSIKILCMLDLNMPMDGIPLVKK